MKRSWTQSGHQVTGSSEETNNASTHRMLILSSLSSGQKEVAGQPTVKA